MSARLDTIHKIYGLYDGFKKLDEIVATSVSEAFTEGRKKWGKDCRAAILLPDASKAKTREPMFLS
jgi:hypothetical protein